MNNKETAKKIAELAFLCVMNQSKGKEYWFNWSPHVELVDVYTYTDDECEEQERIMLSYLSDDDFLEKLNQTIKYLRKEYGS